MKLFNQIQQVKLDFNMCRIDGDEARARITPLIKEYNQKAAEKAIIKGVKPSKLTIKRFLPYI